MEVGIAVIEGVGVTKAIGETSEDGLQALESLAVPMRVDCGLVEARFDGAQVARELPPVTGRSRQERAAKEQSVELAFDVRGESHVVELPESVAEFLRPGDPSFVAPRQVEGLGHDRRPYVLEGVEESGLIARGFVVQAVERRCQEDFVDGVGGLRQAV